MRKRIAVCLFFFCCVLCAGCREENQNQETLGQVKATEAEMQSTTKEREETSDTENHTEKNNGEEKDILKNTEILVFTDGKDQTQVVADKICEKIIGESQDMTAISKEDGKEQIEKAEYILIGTEMNQAEFEPYMMKYMDSELFRGKKVSFFLVNMEQENGVEMEERIKKLFQSFYEDVVILPSILVSTEEEKAEEEEFYINGWLTSILNYRETP